MHAWWNYPPCIQRCNKECLPFNTTLVLRGFIPGFSVTPPWQSSVVSPHLLSWHQGQIKDVELGDGCNSPSSPLFVFPN